MDGQGGGGAKTGVDVSDKLSVETLVKSITSGRSIFSALTPGQTLVAVGSLAEFVEKSPDFRHTPQTKLLLGTKPVLIFLCPLYLPPRRLKTFLTQPGGHAKVPADPSKGSDGGPLKTSLAGRRRRRRRQRREGDGDMIDGIGK